MSSDFYLKAQTLHEEFQKKELQYLNAERKLNNSLWKRDLDVSLQEYLKKIHEREKKNEETYQNIMKQMNELDQHTDLLCLKIEKLGLFQNIQAGHKLSDDSFPLTLRYIPQNLNIVQNNIEPNVSHHASEKFYSSTLKTASTQTDSNVYCDNCRSQIQLSCQPSQVQDSTSSTIDILSVSKDEPEINDSSKFQNNSFSFLNKSDNDSQFNTSSLKAEHFPQLVYQNEKNIKQNSGNVLQANEKNEAKSTVNSTILKDKQPSLQSDDGLISENALKNSESREISTKLQLKENDSEVNVEFSMSKNDADSINHEFDFLESDATHLTSKVQPQDNSKNTTILPSDINKNIDQVTTSKERPITKPVINLKKEKPTFQSNAEQEISDNRSETSVSASGTHSPMLSLSDSESINEGGSFTASAAYQSLLGNTVIPSKINKEVSESDSEDEVEKTLANTVQKSNIKPKSSVQSKKNKSAHQSADFKLADNKPKTVTMNKPQSKLSKNTKKVLGIDTSSSSEIEASVKPLENKKDEDSDEFDFYD